MPAPNETRHAIRKAIAEVLPVITTDGHHYYPQNRDLDRLLEVIEPYISIRAPAKDVPRAAHERLVLQLANERDLVSKRLNEALQRESKLRESVSHVADVVQRDSNGSHSLLAVSSCLQALVQASEPLDD